MTSLEVVQWSLAVLALCVALASVMGVGVAIYNIYQFLRKHHDH